MSSSIAGGILFLDAPGGTGKTYLINYLLAKVRATGDIAIAVASSGIASTLLQGDRTAHSTFKLPLNLAREEHPRCLIDQQHEQAEVSFITIGSTFNVISSLHYFKIRVSFALTPGKLFYKYVNCRCSGSANSLFGTRRR